MLLGKLGSSLLGNILEGKRGKATSCRRGINKKHRGINRAGEGIIRARYGYKNNKMGF